MIKSAAVMIFAVGLVACGRSEPSVDDAPESGKPDVSSVAQDSKFPDSFDSAWVMSSRWSGFMGVAIAISGERYYYWFYSDVSSGLEAEYPFTGTFTIEDDLMELGFPRSLATGRVVLVDGRSELYSYRWKIDKSTGSVRLHSEDDDPDDIARNLILDPDFDPNAPFQNQRSLKP